MKLFYAPGTCATAVHIVLELIGEPYELEKVKLGSEEYKKINPSGAVPSIIDGNSGVMNQADAILKYLSRKYPESNLQGKTDIMAEYDLDRWLAFLTGDLHPSFWPVFSPQKFTDDHSDEGLKKAKLLSKTNLLRFYQILENHLEGKEFIVSNCLTIVDPYAYAMLRWTTYSPLSLNDFPNLKSFCQRIEKLDACIRALEKQGLSKVV